jgi:2-phosphoglycerate kinase
MENAYLNSRTIILVGGMPTAGKSTIAQGLSGQLSLPWISTDHVRIIMREVVNRSEYPRLFNPKDYLENMAPHEIVQLKIDQAETIWLAVKRLIQDDYTWRKGFIVEGVNILPRLVHRDFQSDPHIKAVFLADPDESRIRKVLFSRGIYSQTEPYSDELKEKELKWVLQFGAMIRKDARDYDFPLVQLGKGSDDLRKVLEALGQSEKK